MVSALLTPSLMFQWFCNGAAMAEATNSVLQLTNVALSQNANHYYVVVTNPWGSVTSVPGRAFSGEQGTSLGVANSDTISGSASWSSLQNFVLTTTGTGGH